MNAELGFLGVGTIATAMIQGLRRRWPGMVFRLSPRSADIGRRLADADPLVHVEPSNAAVVAAADIVFLAMRPTQMEDALRGLPFRAGQIVASCVAGAPLEQVSALVAPAPACRVIPLPMIARGEGPLVLYPPLPPLVALFDGLGDVIRAADETAFGAYAACSGTMSTMLALQAAITTWIATHGGTPEGAATYVHALHRGLAHTVSGTHPAALGALIGDHETPGGLNERVRLSLEAQGWFGAVGTALDTIRALRSADLKPERNARARGDRTLRIKPAQPAVFLQKAVPNGQESSP